MPSGVVQSPGCSGPSASLLCEPTGKLPRLAASTATTHRWWPPTSTSTTSLRRRSRRAHSPAVFQKHPGLEARLLYRPNTGLINFAPAFSKENMTTIWSGGEKVVWQRGDNTKQRSLSSWSHVPAAHSPHHKVANERRASAASKLSKEH